MARLARTCLCKCLDPQCSFASAYQWNLRQQICDTGDCLWLRLGGDCFPLKRSLEFKWLYDIPSASQRIEGNQRSSQFLCLVCAQSESDRNRLIINDKRPPQEWRLRCDVMAGGMCLFRWMLDWQVQICHLLGWTQCGQLAYRRSNRQTRDDCASACEHLDFRIVQ